MSLPAGPRHKGATPDSKRGSRSGRTITIGESVGQETLGQTLEYTESPTIRTIQGDFVLTSKVAVPQIPTCQG